jgi:transketolase
MGAAPMAYVLWSRFLRFNPQDPRWPNRDRFILSAGHGSMLLYSLLHLFGYDLPLDEIKRFRQWGSKTPGHPSATYGVEVSTGPLGRVSATALMAIAEAFRRRPTPSDQRCRPLHLRDCLRRRPDGGRGAEAARWLGISSPADSSGDDNLISLDGPTNLAFTEGRALRRLWLAPQRWTTATTFGDRGDARQAETDRPSPPAHDHRLWQPEGAPAGAC